MFKKVAFFLGIIVVLVISYKMVGQTFQALKAGDRLQSEIEKLTSLQIKNEELKNQLSEAKSLDFIEQQARNKLGLVKEGETVVVIPPDRLKQVLGISREEPIEVKLPNWLGWVKLFFK